MANIFNPGSLSGKTHVANLRRRRLPFRAESGGHESSSPVDDRKANPVVQAGDVRPSGTASAAEEIAEAGSARQDAGVGGLGDSFAGRAVRRTSSKARHDGVPDALDTDLQQPD
jgi:hypothetical protein